MSFYSRELRLQHSYLITAPFFTDTANLDENFSELETEDGRIQNSVASHTGVFANEPWNGSTSAFLSSGHAIGGEVDDANALTASSSIIATCMDSSWGRASVSANAPGIELSMLFTVSTTQAYRFSGWTTAPQPSNYFARLFKANGAFWTPVVSSSNEFWVLSGVVQPGSYKFTHGLNGFCNNNGSIGSLLSSQITMAPIGNPTLTGSITLLDTLGVGAGETIDWTMTGLGGTFTGKTYVNDSGTSPYTIDVPVGAPLGNYSMKFKGGTFLSDTVDFSILGTSVILPSAELVNGDIDQDGEVGPSDFEQVVASFGGVGIADVDNDGEVGPGDFEVVVENFGMQDQGS